MAPEIEDPILEHLPFGPKVEPRRKELVKGDEGPGRAGRQPSLEEARRAGPLGWLRLLGPGLITGASDDDPSGIGTYSQVGSQFGYGLLWTALFTYPLMAAVQELCGRIALQTGVGLGTALRRKFPAWLVGLCVLALLVANTVNIGADLGAVAAGGSLLSRGVIRPIWLVIPTALLLVVLQFFFTYRAIFNVFKWLTVALFAYVVTGFVAHPQVIELVRATVVPHVELSKDFVTALVAVLGTTISPYLFFWQASAEVDQRSGGGRRTEALGHHVSSRALRAAQADILIGMAVSQIVMYCIILTSAAVLHAHGKTDVQTAEQAAQALSPIAGPLAFVLFAAGMIGTGLLAIPILSGSAAYAVREFAGFSGTLGAKVQYRPTFYAVIGVATVAGVALNFAHVDPIRALFLTAVVNGVVAPPLLLLIVLLGSDPAFMGERASTGWSKLLTWAATILMGLAAVAMGWTMLAGR